MTAPGASQLLPGLKPTMHEVPERPLLERAHGAAADGHWQQAYELFVQADARQLLTPLDLAVFANCAYAGGHIDATIEAWERAHAEGLRAGDHLLAAGAAVRVALHLLLDTALLAPIRGWASRAERLLEGQSDTPVHAWIAVVRGYERMLSGDFGRAREWARRAIDLGTGRDSAAAALGRIAEARTLILQGEVARGLDLLNEAAVATMSGELDPLSTGVVYCEVVCALQGIAQYDLAEQWTHAMEQWRRGQPVGSIHGRCRVHRAEILRLRGACVEAEQEALGACEELRPYLRREFGWPLTELGRIRLRTGDVRGAEEAFLAAHQAGWDPQPGLALVRLAQGDVPLAAVLIRQALEHPVHVPSKEWPPNSDLRRAPLLAAQGEIEIAAGDIDRARAAADELATISAGYDSPALTAGRHEANGRVLLAEGDAAGAIGDLRTAIRGWRDVGAAHEIARVRVILARALREIGDEDDAELELGAALDEFRRLGAKPDLELVEREMRRAADREGESGKVRRTFVFTDIVGSTRLAEALGDAAWERLLRWHDDTLRDRFARHRGVVVTTTGDGFFVAFESAADAVACAVEIQRSLAEHRSGSGFAPPVRIGIHTADAVMRGTDFSGVGVHAASRLGDLAEGGQILVSQQALAEAGSVRSSDLREASVRGVSQPMQVAEIDWR